LQQAANSLNIEETGNEPIARMKAFAELRKLHPPFNKQVYTKFLPIGLFAERDGSKATFLRVSPVKKKKAVAYFKDQNEAHDFLLQVLVKYKADADVLLMEKDAKALAPFLKKYSYKPERKDIPLATIKREVLPNANFMALGPGRHPNEKSLIWVENHQVKGYAWYELDSFLEDEEVIKKHLTVLTPHPYLNSLLKHYLELGNLKAKTGAN
jgi:hypothetical protein